MTRIGAINFAADTRIELWELKDPAAGNLDLRIVSPSSVGIAVGLSAWEEVSQTEPQRNLATATGVGSPTNNVTSVADDVVVDAVSTKETGAGHTPGAGQTERFDLACNGDDDGLVGSSEDGDTSVVMSWSASITEEWASVATSLQPAVGGGGPGGSPDVNVCWRSSVSDTRTLKERTFVLLREPFSALLPIWPNRYPQLRM